MTAPIPEATTRKLSPAQLAVMEQAAARLAASDAAEETLFGRILVAIRDFLGLTTAAVLGQHDAPDMAAFPPDSAWAGIVEDRLEAKARKVFTDAYLAALPEGDVFNVEPFVAQYIETVRDRLRDWPAGVFELLRGEIADSLAANESIDQLRDRLGAALDIDAPSKQIRDRIAALGQDIAAADDRDTARTLKAQRSALYRDLSAEEREWHWRARRIARTEATGAVNGGALSAHLALAAATGDQMRKQWLATPDERTRHSHARANGQVVFLHEPFRIGGHHLQHPGDPTAPADQVINCRCTLLYWHPGDEPAPLEPIGEDAPSNLASGALHGGLWDELKHPRDRRGRFRSVDSIAHDEGVLAAMRSPGAFRYSHGFGGAGSHDGVLEAIAATRGYHEHPRIVAAAEVDAAIGEGSDELLRAVRDPAHDDAFRNGDYYAGLGTQGNGIYMHWRPSGFDPAREARIEYAGPQYADATPEEIAAAEGVEVDWLNKRLARTAAKIDGRMLDVTRTYGDTISRGALLPGTEVLSYEDDVVPRQQAYLTELRDAAALLTGPERIDAELWIRAMSDPGRFAAALGIAAYYGRVPGEVVVIDRGALLVQRELVT